MPRVAVVDLGTNSTRLLIAEVEDGRVREVERRTNVTRLGEGVDESGRLTRPAIERVLGAVAEYARLIDENGVGHTVALATSAARDAENADELAHDMRERFGIDPRTISGEEEATLTFLGATSELHAGEPTLVLDIGGGSTEFVVGHPGAPPEFHVSTRAGSVRQTERHLSDDPPPREQVDSVSEEVRGIIEEAVPADTRAAVDRGIAVAGTATSCAAIAQSLDPYDPAKVHGAVMPRDEVAKVTAKLLSLDLDAHKKLPGLQPKRADVIPAGAAILQRVLERCAAGELVVSDRGIRFGLLP
jgi:exopolyphosphatase/guanosine-5'-triphosphate,3'-diphosphate pyrophosphatase